MSAEAQTFPVTTFTFLRSDIEKFNLTPYLEKLKAISDNQSRPCFVKHEYHDFHGRWLQ